MTKIEQASINTQLSLQRDIISNHFMARRYIESDVKKARVMLCDVLRNESEESRKLKSDDPNRILTMTIPQFEALHTLLGSVISPMSDSCTYGYDKDTELKSTILKSLTTD